MHQYIDDRTLVIIGLIAANVGFFTLLFYRPKDILPSSYDLLKWIAALHFIAGILILSSLAAPVFFFLLCISYLIAYKQCYKDAPDAYTLEEASNVKVESTVLPVAALIIWLIARHYPLSGSLIVVALGGFYSCRLYSAYANALAVKDTEQKKRFIAFIGKLAFPLSKLLCRYHHDWYPPPVNHVLANS